LFEWFETAVLSDISEIVEILLWLQLLNFIICLPWDDVGPGVLREGKLVHFLVANLHLLDGGDLAHDLDTVHLCVFNVLNPTGRQDVFLVRIEFDQLVDLVLRKQFHTFSAGVDNEDPRENETPNERILVNSDLFNISVSLEGVSFLLDNIVIIDFKIWVVHLDQLRVGKHTVDEWLLAISDGQVDQLWIICDASVVDTWGVLSIGLVELLEVVCINT
jgi:hypothetical protein